jgi:hypothetical protein
MAHMRPPWLNYALLIGVPALVIVVQLPNEWEADRNRHKARKAVSRLEGTRENLNADESI